MTEEQGSGGKDRRRRVKWDGDKIWGKDATELKYILSILALASDDHQSSRTPRLCPHDIANRRDEKREMLWETVTEMIAGFSA